MAQVTRPSRDVVIRRHARRPLDASRRPQPRAPPVPREECASGRLPLREEGSRESRPRRRVGVGVGGSSAKLVLGERVEERACGLHIRRVSQRPADWRCSLVGRRVGRGAAQDTVRVPAIAMLEPMTPSVEIGVLKAMTEATMMTTRLMVLPTACVTCRRTAARSVAEMELQCGARRQRGHRVDAAEGEEGNLRRQTRHAPRATPLAPRPSRRPRQARARRGGAGSRSSR